jgi:hypothetical protein
MTTVSLVARVNGVICASVLDGDLKWTPVEMGAPVRPENALPIEVLEIQIVNKFGVFRAVLPHFVQRKHSRLWSLLRRLDGDLKWTLVEMGDPVRPENVIPV